MDHTCGLRHHVSYNVLHSLCCLPARHPSKEKAEDREEEYDRRVARSSFQPTLLHLRQDSYVRIRHLVGRPRKQLWHLLEKHLIGSGECPTWEVCPDPCRICGGRNRNGKADVHGEKVREWHSQSVDANALTSNSTDSPPLYQRKAYIVIKLASQLTPSDQRPSTPFALRSSSISPSIHSSGSLRPRSDSQVAVDAMLPVTNLLS